jgi:hypothetical protein
MRLAIVGIALLGMTLTTAAEAAPRHKTTHTDHNRRVISYRSADSIPYPLKTRHQSPNREYEAQGVKFLPHPPGCPRIAFCGCGAAYRVWGTTKRALWRAAAWFHFPRSMPGPGKAAVRSHHVMILERHLGGKVWLATDYNSGGHRSRLHAVNISGYTIVDPNG